ncbi:MAG: pitrilysin family protein [Myxococcota bacterium]
MPQVHSAVLDSGLRLAVVELPHLHLATVAAFVRVGARFESPEDSGLSHFVEHMLFRGTELHPSSRDLAVAVESLGATLDAETGRDMSILSLAVPPDLVGAALAVLAEVIGRPRLAEIELERALILEELREDYDEDGNETHAEDIARGLLFGDHPLGQRIIGSEANIRRFTRDDVLRHFRRHYCASNMLICVAGPVAAEAVVGAAASALGFIPSGVETTAPAPRFDQHRVLYQYERRSGAQTDVHLLFRSVPDMDPDYLASVALLRAIDDGMSTPLHYELCDRRGLAYSVGAAIEPLADVALLEVSGTTGQAKVPDLLAGILELLGRFRDQPISAGDLARIKQRYRSDMLAALDDSAAMASWFGGTALYYPPSDLDQRLAGMAAITADDIRAAAERVLRPERLAIAVVGPLSRARQGEVRELAMRWR